MKNIISLLLALIIINSCSKINKTPVVIVNNALLAGITHNKVLTDIGKLPNFKTLTKQQLLENFIISYQKNTGFRVKQIPLFTQKYLSCHNSEISSFLNLKNFNIIGNSGKLLLTELQKITEKNRNKKQQQVIDCENFILKINTTQLSPKEKILLLGTTSILKNSTQFWLDAKQNINNSYYYINKVSSLSKVQDGFLETVDAQAFANSFWTLINNIDTKDKTTEEIQTMYNTAYNTSLFYGAVASYGVWMFINGF